MKLHFIVLPPACGSISTCNQVTKVFTTDLQRTYVGLMANSPMTHKVLTKDSQRNHMGIAID